MSFLEKILTSNRPQRHGSTTGYRDRRSVGAGFDAADVAFYGPMAFRGPVETCLEES